MATPTTPIAPPVPGDIMSTEPSRVIAWITGFIGALITLGVVFGLDLSAAQQGAIAVVGTFLAPILAGHIIRRRVPSPQTAQAAVNQAAATGVATNVMTGTVPRDQWGTEVKRREREAASGPTRINAP